MKNPFWLLLFALFLARLAFGLCSEFWFPDELQIYLIGLKSYCLDAWPWFGPDVVYTRSQIPGALQGLLVGLPIFAMKMPESPLILLNLMSFGGCCLFAFFLKKHLPRLPSWVIYGWILTCPWTMGYGTRVVNPSYVLPFSMLFFTAFFDLAGTFGRPVFSRKWMLFWLGLAVTCIWQLHMSWLLLGPFCGFVFWKNRAVWWKFQAESMAIFALGLFIGGLTLWPTLLKFGFGGTGQNLVFSPENWQSLPVVFSRFASFSSFEIPYWLGGSGEEKTAALHHLPWLWPIAGLLLVVGWAQVAVFGWAFFWKNRPLPTGDFESEKAFSELKKITVATWILVWLSFFFSIKGPSSHTFYVVFPISMAWSLVVYERFFQSNRWWKTMFGGLLVANLLFHAGVGYHNFGVRSLYLDRPKIERAIESKNWEILGIRRADEWGKGF